MIRSTRRVEATELGAVLSNVALVHSRLRAHAVHNARVINEDLLLTQAYARAGRTQRSVATILIEGRARITAYDRHVWMAPGDIVVVDSKGAIQMRQEGDPYCALAFEWDPEWLGKSRAPLSKIDGRDVLVPLREVWSGARSGQPAAEAIEALVAHLVLAGIALRRVRARELEEEVPERMHALTEALDVALSNLTDQPMMLDLESKLGLSARQLNRLILDYNERYGFNSSGWIDTRNRRRLLAGATFMTARGATAAYVAGAVGYRSTAAFTHALRTAGLPPPSRIADQVKAIADATT